MIRVLPVQVFPYTHVSHVPLNIIQLESHDLGMAVQELE